MRGESIEELRSQCDFRHEDEGLPVAPDIFGHPFEIDFRLARACHTIE
jgi:hypothetical protein